MRHRVAAWLTIVVLLPLAARAVCTAPNGTFDTTTTDWLNFAAFDGALGNPPGSDEVGPIPTNSCGNSLSICLPTSPGEVCNLSAEVLFPLSEDPAAVGAQLGVIYFSDGACGTFVSISAATLVSASQQNTWIPTDAGLVTAPATAHSYRLSLNVCAGSATSLTANWDNVEMSQPSIVQIPALGAGGLAALAILIATCALVALRIRQG